MTPRELWKSETECGEVVTETDLYLLLQYPLPEVIYKTLGVHGETTKAVPTLLRNKPPFRFQGLESPLPPAPRVLGDAWRVERGLIKSQITQFQGKA